MKKFGKLTSLLLALVLVFSLSVTAFAAIPPSGSINATVVFYDGDEYLMDWAVEMTEKNATTSYEIPTPGPGQYLDSRIISNANRPSAMDATLVALDEIGTPETIGWDYYPVSSTLTEIRGGYLDTIFGYTTETTAYLEPTENYNGYWEGNAWLYKVLDADGNVVVEPGINDDVYATNIELEEGMTIVWTYTYDIHEVIYS